MSSGNLRKNIFKIKGIFDYLIKSVLFRQQYKQFLLLAKHLGFVGTQSPFGVCVLQLVLEQEQSTALGKNAMASCCFSFCEETFRE
jgi:hypothetical protein